MERLLCFHKGILSSHVNEFSFEKLSLCSERKAFYVRKKTRILILKVMIKNLCCCFCTKTLLFLILYYRGVGDRLEEGEEDLSKWNHGKIIWIWVKLFWEHSVKWQFNVEEVEGSFPRKQENDSIRQLKTEKELVLTHQLNYEKRENLPLNKNEWKIMKKILNSS